MTDLERNVACCNEYLSEWRGGPGGGGGAGGRCFVALEASCWSCECLLVKNEEEVQSRSVGLRSSGGFPAFQAAMFFILKEESDRGWMACFSCYHGNTL